MTNAFPPAHWAADPSGRHEHRYWDGTRWTDHVADQGRTSVDPIAADPTSSAAATAAADDQSSVAQPSAAPASITWRADAASSADVSEPVVEGAADTANPFDTLRAPEDTTATADADVTWPPEPGLPEPAPALAPPVSATPPSGVLAPPPPLPPPPPPPGTGHAGTGRARAWGAGAWRSLTGLKTALVVLFIIMGVSALATAGTALNRIRAIDDFQDNPSFTTAASLDDADDALSGAGAISSIIRIALIVVFIIWLWRVAKNALEALDREDPKLGPGWAIGGWFIPLANLVLPIIVIQGLWRASASGTRPGTTWRSAKGSALVVFWWLTFIVSFLSGTAGDDATLDEVKFADTLTAVGAVASVVAAVLAIFVVVQLTRRFNERRAEELGR